MPTAHTHTHTLLQHTPPTCQRHLSRSCQAQRAVNNAVHLQQAHTSTYMHTHVHTCRQRLSGAVQRQGDLQVQPTPRHSCLCALSCSQHTHTPAYTQSTPSPTSSHTHHTHTPTPTHLCVLHAWLEAALLQHLHPHQVWCCQVHKPLGHNAPVGPVNQRQLQQGSSTPQVVKLAARYLQVTKQQAGGRTSHTELAARHQNNK